MPQRDGGLVTYLADAVGMVRPEADPPDEGVSAFKGKGCIPLPFGCGETSELHHLFIVLLCERGPAARGGPELYLTDNSIVVKTELKGPERSEPTGEEPSYPYIVLRTELLEEPVVFQ